MSFAITDHKGFSIRFPNGWAISVQFGPYNYCDHHPHWGLEGRAGYPDYDTPKTSDRWASTQAEVAAMNADCWWDFEEHRPCAKGAYVAGYQEATAVLAMINEIAALPGGEKAPEPTPEPTEPA